TRPEGLGGSRDAGPAVAGPRPPYVTEAEAATARLRRTAATAVRAVRANLSSSSSSSFPSYGPTPPLRPFQGRGIQQFLDQFEERVLDRRVDWLPFFVAPPCLRQIQVLTEDLPWPAAKTALLRYYGAFNQIRTVGFYDKLRRHEARRPKTKDTIDWLEKHAFLCRKLRRHEARRPKTKDTIDWLEKHAFFCRKVGPSPGPDESTEHSYGLFQALPKEIQGLGGSRDAGPAVAGPRPPYVTEAVRHSGCGYGTATPYSGYGRTGRTGRTREGT
ncbi:hypothetical protein L249_7601, partial [Ophiocordyceps polyrhachis-furcata BCC 54312]